MTQTPCVGMTPDQGLSKALPPQQRFAILRVVNIAERPVGVFSRCHMRVEHLFDFAKTHRHVNAVNQRTLAFYVELLRRVFPRAGVNSSSSAATPSRHNTRTASWPLRSHTRKRPGLFFSNSMRSPQAAPVTNNGDCSRRNFYPAGSASARTFSSTG